MRERIICSLLLLVVTNLCFCKEYNPYGTIKHSRISVELDYTESLIAGQSYDVFSDYQEDMETMKKEWYGKFISNFYPPVEKSKVQIVKEQAQFYLKIKFHTIERNGDLSANVLLFDSEGNLLAQKEFRGKGGHIGSLSNLIGDGHESLGENVGWFFRHKMAHSK